ncbi:hypothetical protein RHSIM_Rhsim03G0228900 [Rhododendron simsii]|uniref:Mediator of RNA polymerase II transcription subunit 20 n=1 Tax=Rhododendron simsii TaxID=118357 RepID=A0A834HJF1_RHOSS|nr:hypothetical protein RHSIM_Rhsim03G0228900 [Rhododendron simsii]
MGIKWVLHWQPNAGNTINSQILNEISQCAESINGVKEGRWKATLTFYKPMLRGTCPHPLFSNELRIILLRQNTVDKHA